MPGTPARIAIVGSPGSGKSKLARELGELLGLDVYHLDDLHWKAGARMPDAEWSTLHADLIAHDAWIIDGTFSGTMRERFERADTIVFLDVSPLVCAIRVLRRRVSHALRRNRSERPNYPVYVDAELVGWVFRFRRDKGREIRRLMDALSGETRTVTVRTGADVRDLLGRLARARAID